MKIPTRTPKINLGDDNPVGRGKRATLLFDVQTDPGQTMPLDNPEIESSMIKLMIREMGRNECPEEQYERLGLPKPQRIGVGHSDDRLKMPSDAEINKACLLRTPEGKAYKKNAGNGFPKMPFQKMRQETETKVSDVSFPKNLRLRAGYTFSQKDKPPKKT